MRILIVSDIHGNRAALDVIRETYDVCLCLGDIVDYGPEPGACVDWVRENATHCVRGNHDHGVAHNVALQGVSGFRYLTAVTRPLSVSLLTDDQRRYLADLPMSQMLNLDGNRFLLVHATPRDPMDEYALADTATWEPLLAGLKVDFVLVGHTHQLYSLQVNGIMVVNPGSVGLNRNGDPRATYAVIDNGKVELKQVEYPVEKTVAALDGFVNDAVAKQMLTDIYRGNGLVGRWAAEKVASVANDSNPE
ncbi:MAG: YfcE family phosphodiesterase [Planctomycetaceae bacterium]|nr:YfcE family phosphodiesterase [Planctomycetaceae bacterium]